MKTIRKIIRRLIYKQVWKKTNKHNLTKAVNFFDFDKVSVVNYIYGPLFIKKICNEQERLRIRNFCSIADGVKFLSSGEHVYDVIGAFPFEYYFLIPDVQKQKDQ